MEKSKKEFYELSPNMQKSLFETLIFFLSYKGAKNPTGTANRLLSKPRHYKHWKQYRYQLAIRVDKKREEMGLDPVFIEK